jgi:hypothetical protein
MENSLKYYFSDFDRNPSNLTPKKIEDLEKNAKLELPQEYKNTMLEFNGGEGPVGDNSWLCLYPLDKLLEINKNYELLMEQIPEFFLFGKDAADTGYAFHKSKKTFHGFGLMSDFKTDHIEFYGNTFIEFIEYLYNQ